MEKEFFDLFAKRKDVLLLDVSYDRQCDWTIIVSDRSNDLSPGEVIPQIFIHQHPDRSLCFAKAYASLADWYCEKLGGY